MDLLPLSHHLALTNRPYLIDLRRNCRQTMLTSYLQIAISWRNVVMPVPSLTLTKLISHYPKTVAKSSVSEYVLKYRLVVQPD